MDIKVISDKVKYTENYIEAKYEYQYTSASRNGNKILVRCINYFMLNIFKKSVVVKIQIQIS